MRTMEPGCIIRLQRHRCSKPANDDVGDIFTLIPTAVYVYIVQVLLRGDAKDAEAIRVLHLVTMVRQQVGHFGSNYLQKSTALINSPPHHHSCAVPAGFVVLLK